MGDIRVEQMAARVAALMEERLRIRGAGLAAKIRHGGRALPRRIRRQAQVLVEAEAQSQVPKLQLQLDHERIARAYDACVRYLQPLGRGARWRNYALNLLAALALTALVTGALVIAVLVWRGYL